VFIPVGSREVVPAAWALIEDADYNLPDALRPIFAEACREIEARVKQVARQLEAVGEQLPAARIPSWPGIPRDSSNEAGDTFAVRPVSPERRRG
jgi:hypothetical protein